MTPYRIRFSSDLPIYPQRLLSHLLICIAVFVSIFGFIFPSLIGYFGLHRLPLSIGAIPYYIGQILLFQFLHGGILHIFFNAYFLYQAGPEVESRMSRVSFLRFFLSGTIFVALALYLFAPYSLTIGVSGFCMALLSYLWMDMKNRGDLGANQILTMLIINIALGFTGNISFVGHAAGAVWGIIWWRFYRR